MNYLVHGAILMALGFSMQNCKSTGKDSSASGRPMVGGEGEPMPVGLPMPTEEDSGFKLHGGGNKVACNRERPSDLACPAVMTVVPKTFAHACSKAGGEILNCGPCGQEILCSKEPDYSDLKLFNSNNEVVACGTAADRMRALCAQVEIELNTDTNIKACQAKGGEFVICAPCYATVLCSHANPYYDVKGNGKMCVVANQETMAQNCPAAASTTTNARFAKACKDKGGKIERCGPCLEEELCTVKTRK